MGQKFPGTFARGSESSKDGTFAPWSESSIIRFKGPITNFFGVCQDVSYDNLQLVLVSTVAKKCTAEIRVSLKPDRKTADKTAKIHSDGRASCMTE